MGGGYTPKFDPETGSKILPFRVISNDDHIGEPGDLWKTRIDKKFRDRAIHIDSLDDGDWYFCDGNKILGLASSGAQSGYRFDKEKKKEITRGQGLHFEDVRPGAYDPDIRLKDMEIDGIDKQVIYPTVGLVMWQGMIDSDLLSAHCRTYNDYLAEFCKVHPDKLYGIGTINMDSVEEAVAELKRCHKLNMVGAMIPQVQPSLMYNSPDWEPFWATAEDLGLPLSLHIETQRTTPEIGFQTPLDGERPNDPRNIGNHESDLKRSLTQIISTGVLERHPNLHVGIIELGLGWVPFFLQKLDRLYMDGVQAKNLPNMFKNAMLPSDFFHRQVFIGYQEDELGIQLRNIIGVDNIQWGSDYPHPESTWPVSRNVIEENLRECSLVEKTKICGANCARVYHLD